MWRKGWERLTKLSERNFALGLAAAYLAIGLPFVLKFHEMWRDELQAWLIARDSSTPAQVIHNIRYEKSPALWHLLLWCVTRFTDNPMAMQLLSVLIGAVTVFLIGRYAPFRKWQKILLSFGYFTFFEYGIIARSYGLALLFVVLLCVLAMRRRPNYLLIGIVMLLLAQTTPLALMLIPPLGLYLLIDYYYRYSGFRNGPRLWALIGGIAITGLGIILCLLQLRTPPDYVFGASGAHGAKLVVSYAWNSFAPIPPRTIQFWNLNFIKSVNVAFWLALICLAGATACFWRVKKILLTYLLGVAGLLLFFEKEYSGYIRHQGFLFVLFMACFWFLASHYQQTKKTWPILTSVFFGLVLAAQFGASVMAAGKDYKLSFSGGKAAAEFIKSSRYANDPLIIYGENQSAPILGYTGKKAYFIQGARYGSFVIFDRYHKQIFSPEGIENRAIKQAAFSGTQSLLVSTVKLAPNLYPSKLKLVYQSRTDTVVVADETYFIYVVQP